MGRAGHYVYGRYARVRRQLHGGSDVVQLRIDQFELQLRHAVGRIRHKLEAVFHG